MVKTLDPFAGYRAASGHPFFHVALFFGSYLGVNMGALEFESSKGIQIAFTMLRWGHFVLFMLGIIKGLTGRPS